MANWGEALKTFGASLQGFALQRLDREAQDINAMRVEAMKKLEMKHDEDLQAAGFAHSEELFKREGERKQVEFGQETAARAGEAEREHQWQAARDKAQFAQQSGLLDKKNLQDAIEAENRNLTAELTNFQDTRQSLQQQMAEMTDKGEVLDPAGAKAHQALLADLDVRERAARKNHLINTKRIMAGGYGKPEVLSAEDVAKIIAEKAPEPVQPKTEPVEAKPGEPQPAQAPQAKPQGQPAQEPELFSKDQMATAEQSKPVAALNDAFGGVTNAISGAVKSTGEFLARGNVPENKPPQQAAAPPQPPAQGRPAFSGFVDSVRSSLDATRGRMQQSMYGNPNPFMVGNELFPQQPQQPNTQAAR